MHGDTKKQTEDMPKKEQKSFFNQFMRLFSKVMQFVTTTVKDRLVTSDKEVEKKSKEEVKDVTGNTEEFVRDLKDPRRDDEKHFDDPKGESIESVHDQNKDSKQKEIEDKITA